MKNKNICKRVFAFGLAGLMLLTTACGSETKTGDVSNYKKESESMTYFSSSDESLDKFLNDFFKRHVGVIDEEEGDMAVNSLKPGSGFEGMFNHEWVTMAVSWFNSFDGLESDRLTSLRNALESVPVDRYGYVWDGPDGAKSLDDTTATTAVHSMGWPFPRATDSEGWSTYWDFNTGTGAYEGEPWTTNFDAKVKEGMLGGTITEGVDKVVFTSPEMTSINSIMTYHAPYLELDLRMYTDSYNNIEDIYVWYKNDNSEEWSTEKRVSVKEIAAVDYDFEAAYEHVLYLPMYAEEHWDSDANKQVTQLKVEIVAKEGTKLDGKFGINHVKCLYDTRHSNNNSNYITSMKYYYNFSGDVAYLEDAIVDARKAMNFFMQMYDEERHLNNQTYMVGHDSDKSSNVAVERMASCITNGYWDVLYMTEYDFQSNMYFYKAIQDLIYLENALASQGIEVDKALSAVQTAERDGTKGVSEYKWEVADLEKVAEEVLSELRKSTDDKSQTGFWDETSGRFICGYNPDGEPVDYGYVIWNLEAIHYGIATEEQEKSIMDWISGERIVEADKTGSTGEDIYYYELSPRITTMNKDGLFNGYYENAIGGSVEYGVKQIQYGGAATFLSYFDLMSRIKTYGTDDAFTRLKGIQEWYEKVYDYYKNENENPEPFDFYWDYYKDKVGITPQSGVHPGGGSGIVGVDGEFLENLLMIAAVPYGFFGVDTTDGKCLTVSPQLPEELDWWKIENLGFNRVKYDLSVYANAVRIDSVRGNADGLSIQVSLDEPKGSYGVYVNGVETKDYTEEDGKVIVTVPFASAIIEVR